MDIRARGVKFDGNLGIPGGDGRISFELLAQVLDGMYELPKRVGIGSCDADDEGLELRIHVGP